MSEAWYIVDFLDGTQFQGCDHSWQLSMSAQNNVGGDTADNNYSQL